MSTNTQQKWYLKSGSEGDVVISTRIRFARNLEGFPFPARMTASQKDTVEEKVRDALFSAGSGMSGMFRYIPLENLNKQQLVSMVEKHFVSPNFIASPHNRGLILSGDDEVSVMINEEDHLRIQVMKEGMQLTQAFDLADKIDNLLSEKLRFAFDPELGYLTRCPTNLGTAMRASLMLHLPALQESGGISRICSDLSKLGFVMRGTYGEGTQAAGAIYQLSNQVTLGLSEQEALDNLSGVAKQIITQERRAREEMAREISVQDKVLRALGILKSARMLSCSEMMNLLALVRLGVSQKLVENIGMDTVNALLVLGQPATLCESGANADSLTPQQRDIARAKLVQQALA